MPVPRVARDRVDLRRIGCVSAHNGADAQLGKLNTSAGRPALCIVIINLVHPTKPRNATVTRQRGLGCLANIRTDAHNHSVVSRLARAAFAALRPLQMHHRIARRKSKRAVCFQALPETSMALIAPRSATDTANAHLDNYHRDEQPVALRAKLLKETLQKRAHLARAMVARRHTSKRASKQSGRQTRGQISKQTRTRTNRGASGRKDRPTNANAAERQTNKQTKSRRRSGNQHQHRIQTDKQAEGRHG